jgi:uncharacterized membrane protein HdeD (DUF308 family)
MTQMFLASLQCLAFQSAAPSGRGVIILLFGTYFLIDGICAIVAGLKIVSSYRRGRVLIADGILRLLLVPVAWHFGLLSLMLIVTGVLEIVAAMQLRKSINGILFFAGAGIASVLFLPFAIASMSLRLELGFPSLFGAYAIIFGALLLTFGFLMRGIARPTG